MRNFCPNGKRKVEVSFSFDPIGKLIDLWINSYSRVAYLIFLLSFLAEEEKGDYRMLSSSWLYSFSISPSYSKSLWSTVLFDFFFYFSKSQMKAQRRWRKCGYLDRTLGVELGRCLKPKMGCLLLNQSRPNLSGDFECSRGEPMPREMCK